MHCNPFYQKSIPMVQENVPNRSLEIPFKLGGDILVFLFRPFLVNS